MLNCRVVCGLVLFALMVPTNGCQTVKSGYYNAWEGMGYAKRERLADNIKAANVEQSDAKKQFASALEEFKSVVNFQGGDLEKTYNKVNSQYEDCESQAEDVRSKIKSVKSVATALFTEWTGEIKQIKDDAALQNSSQELYNKTKASYDSMITRMDGAAASMDPILTKFKNRVLFIKHNLNAQAISQLKGTELDLGKDIDQLIKTMDASIAEADQFIGTLKTK